MHKAYTRLLLNPFFDMSWAKDSAALAIHEMAVFAGEDEDEISSGSGSSRSSFSSLENEERKSSSSMGALRES